ncbi:MAG: NAD(P)H-dependent oxidoreductase [Lactobacillus sp.]|nr:NAD(P)H-dependent oxidoreductase [Lactobacillus sp.]MCI2034038.1 NAD(P)H-dependent oxidoreductase [Lactobacillus sp.]
MTQTKPMIGMILGSNRPARIGDAVATWALNTLQHPAYDMKLIDLAETALPFLNEPDIPAHGHYQNPSTQAFADVIAGCAGFVLVFPQYNWGYPAVLKNALDTLYAEWANKPVGTLIYGGHTFQADLAIRLVLTGLHMDQLATNVGIHLPIEINKAEVAQACTPYSPLVKAMGEELTLRLAHAHN